MTWKITAGIHWEALKLWLKGARFRRSPAPPKPVSYRDERCQRCEPGEVTQARTCRGATWTHVRLDKTNFQRIAAGLPAKARMVLSAAMALPRGISEGAHSRTAAR